MFFVRQLSLLFALLIVLTGCAIPLQREQVGALSREISPPELEHVLENGTLVARFQFKLDETSYDAREYRLVADVTEKNIEMCYLSPVTKYTWGSCTAKVPTIRPFFVVQRLPSQTLVAWGTLSEMYDSPDPEVQAIIPSVEKLRKTARGK